ncbi:MAG: preprotein translocase subunit SecG [Puniceicoccaceae bacterium]
MLEIIISFLTFVLLLVSLFLVLVILMQRANSNAGMGSAFGGGVTESAFGAETTNVLVRATKWGAFAFFILALILFLLYMSKKANGTLEDSDLPNIPVVQEESSAEDTAATAMDAFATETSGLVEQAAEDASDAAATATESEAPANP